jgi:hypothetical protein
MACEMIPQDRTAGGIALPEAGDRILGHDREAQRAIVVAVGPEVVYYKPGDIVLVRAGQFLIHERNRYAIVPEEETFGCVNRDLERPSNEELIKIEAQRKLRELIFNECSKTVADIVRAMKRQDN